ncbi:MAG TPA: glycerophosphodiester phosphodiesterase [Chthonomonadaceae bacterium]|nr:glycerophosphodiester phosphodiesterase [Chthonomonadaceae bacterium]
MLSRPWHKVGHRGAPREFPANTLRSFQRAVERGCTMVECDIQQAADGVLVLAHDLHVTDAQGQHYAIAAETSDALARLDLGAGEGVPTLQALVDWAAGKCAVMADMKCEGGDIEAKVVQALSELPLDAKLVPGAGPESRARFRALDPTLPLSLSLGSREGLILLHERPFESVLAALDTQAVTWEHPLLTAERIAAFHAHHIRVFAWTVDAPDTMHRLLADGVDGLISNRVDLLENL